MGTEDTWFGLAQAGNNMQQYYCIIPQFSRYAALLVGLAYGYKRNGIKVTFVV